MTGSARATPLFGWRVLVPRPAGRADELADLLRRTGAEPVPVPLIETLAESGSSEMRRAVGDLAAGAFDWVAFTSVAAVSATMDAARLSRLERPVGGATRVAAVGESTAAALHRAGIATDLVPDGAGSAAALIAAWPVEPPGRSVLLPRSDHALLALPDALRRKGYRVRQVVAYRTVPLPAPATVAGELAAGQIRSVLLTSPSTAAALAEVPIASGTVVIAIGTSTAAAARRFGLAVTATASQPSAAGLVDALIRASVTAPSVRP
jgi:uroporphyrinogen-III synthase